jgi:hypothetical protein
MMKINLERVMNLLHIEEKVRVQPRLKKIHDAVVRELEQHADGTAPEAAEVPDLTKPVPQPKIEPQPKDLPGVNLESQEEEHTESIDPTVYPGDPNIYPTKQPAYIPIDPVPNPQPDDQQEALAGFPSRRVL